ncbi:MAG TPA: TIGR02453 family protein, partial [Thermoplasmata archaeon]|nr:TIGR02453 family protein [Thermoplasmata archaeon]
MAEKSKYFTPEFFAFFSDLAKNNNKEWFTENKERYEKAVQEPSLLFIRDAGSRLQKISSYIVADAKPFGGSLSRIYRDIRFSPDKSPYKTEVGIHFWHAKAPGPEEMAPGYYLHMSSGETMAHSGVWHPDAPILKKIRDRI